MGRSRIGGEVSKDQRGMSLSVFFAALVPALLLVAGLVVDGGAQAAAAGRAELGASAAARAAVDESAAARVAGAKPDSGAALAAGQRMLTAQGLAGSVRLEGDRVVVNTHTQVPTVFLSLIGVSALPASGSAEADLFADR